MYGGNTGIHEAVSYWLSEITCNGHCRQDLLLGTTRDKGKKEKLAIAPLSGKRTVHVLFVMFHDPLA